MKIYSGNRRMMYFAYNQERFRIKSFDQKIIKEYSSLNEFFWKITSNQLSQEISKPNGFYAIQSGRESTIVHYDPHQLNVRMLLDFFRKLGLEMKLEENRLNKREEREALFGKTDESLDVGPNGPIIGSFFQIVPDKSDSKIFPVEFEKFLVRSDVDDEAHDRYWKDGLYSLLGWDKKNIIYAEYAENLITDDDVIAYCKEKFGMVVKADIDR